MDEFLLHSDFALRWTRDAMTQDLTYHKARQSLWQRLTSKLDEPPPHPPYVVGVDRWLPTFRQFLTARNESVNDNMRLAFDVALRELRSAVRRLDTALAAEPEGRSVSPRES